MRQKTRDGRYTDRKDTQDRLLGVLYGSVPGRMLLKPLTAPWVSRFAGALLSTVSYNEGMTVPGIAHAVVIEHV